MTDLGGVLTAGPAENFFERVMQSPDAAPPQFVNVHRAIQRAVDSGDPTMQAWARDMNAAIDRTAEGAALAREASSNPFGNIMASFGNIISAIRTAFADGFQMSDLGALMNAFNGQADPVQQRLAEADQSLEDANARLRGMTEADRTRLGLNQQDVDETLSRIQRTGGIQPAAPAGPGGP